MPKLDKARGILLDIGLTEAKQPNFIKMGKKKNSDVLHDLEKFPWPIESDSCLIVLAAHIAEHIKPWLIVRWMDELWRIMKKDGQLSLSVPYAGSPEWHHDPTHCTTFTELSFAYFDPAYPKLYNVHHPKPWRIEKGSPIWKSEGSIECLLRPVK